MTRVARTVVVESFKLPKKVFRVLVEPEGMYRNMVEQLVMYAVRDRVKSFTRLKALKSIPTSTITLRLHSMPGRQH